MFIRFRTSHWRLKVYVVENARRGGKVVQETVAYLGGVDTRALIGPADDDRERQSIQSRTAFWEAANPKLKNLANRLGGEAEVKRLRMAIHARVPWPMEAERERLRLLEAEREAKMWHHMYSQTNKMLEANERLIAKATEQNSELRRSAMREIEWANKSLADAAALRKQAAHDD